MKKILTFIIMVIITIGTSSCTNKCLEKFTPVDPTAVSIKLACDKKVYNRNEDILFKLYYSHWIENYQSEIRWFDFILELNGVDKIILFEESQTSEEFFDSKNYSDTTSNFFFFSYPTYVSYYEVNANFNNFNIGDYVLNYLLDVRDLNNINIYNYTISFNIEINENNIIISEG